MRTWWKNHKYNVIAGIILGAIILTIGSVIVACAAWITVQPLWDYQFAKWLKTATIGEVVLLFGSFFVVVRLLSNPSLTVKKDD